MFATKPVLSLHEMSALEITAAIGGGRTTCEAVARACLERIAAREFAERCRRSLAPVFDDYDVLLVPAAVGEAPIGLNTGDSSLCSSWTLMHVPTMSIPVFKGPNGLPVGAQLIAARNDDPSSTVCF